MRGTDPRRLAAQVLAAVEDGQWSDEVLARALGESGLGDNDRGLVTRIVYGTIALQRTLDHTLTARSSRPLERIDLPVLMALRIGLFQLCFLDRVPDHAAISTAVELLAGRSAGAKGFVNALLRRAQREGLAPLPDGPLATRLGIAHSHPDWLVERWLEELGQDETEALLAADNEAAPTCYRALGNRAAAQKALSVVGIDSQACRFSESAFTVAGPVLDLDGLAVVQGEASQLVVALLDPRPGERVLDACAAPGGKTAAIAARVGHEGSVVACDPSPRARQRIASLLGAARVDAKVDFHACGAEQLPDSLTAFDAVLVDAPCSGLGTLRQHPEIRWRRDPEDIAQLAGRQRAILAAAAARVRPGGRLVYSTCTLLAEENDDVVEAFLARHPAFSRTPADELPAEGAACRDASGVLRTFPHRHGMDGFFGVRLQRSGDDPA